MSTLPPELVELIIYDIWHSEMLSWCRQSFMTTCPQINRTWKDIFASIASRDMYITNLGYLYYLCDVARCRNSIIYDDLSRQTRTITCFVDLLQEEFGDDKVFSILANLPNDVGFRALFPLAELIFFELRWIGGTRLANDELEVYDLPIHLRCCRYLSKSTQKNEEVRLDVCVSITDPDPFSRLYRSNWSSTFLALRTICIPPKLVSSVLPYDGHAKSGALHFRQTVYVHQSKGDLEGINLHLWMAAKQVHGFRCLASPFYYLKYHLSQWSLPVLYSPCYDHFWGTVGG
ncbi:uncharacterized protein EV420DRAFT_1510630 [Desarmillaria tabescens]|uniref:F-box domain-containing protein n=1 Tax=Armillaria tabescens TaxID=1929756 RepID=A0AA39NIG3_ARMTA|nr:uncharacterized protein EV420DRAFT_1510630 [Desarmillaria tabescens]KAK0466224.1 hypothetical protein EV420DRAFT_1510630 [Desarmillaria tabescens]